jgi:hypothetical protein
VLPALVLFFSLHLCVFVLASAAPAGPLRLQVTGFKPGLAEAEIQQIFEPFGPIESVQVVRDGAGQPINIAYVMFVNKVDGQNAQVLCCGSEFHDVPASALSGQLLVDALWCLQSCCRADYRMVLLLVAHSCVMVLAAHQHRLRGVCQQNEWAERTGALLSCWGASMILLLVHLRRCGLTPCRLCLL